MLMLQLLVCVHCFYLKLMQYLCFYDFKMTSFKHFGLNSMSHVLNGTIREIHYNHLD